MTYFHKLVTWLDQGLNVIFLAGYPDETLSAHFHRWARDKQYIWPKKITNMLFFWQRDHCYSAYMNEIKRRQYPPEYRNEHNM